MLKKAAALLLALSMVSMTGACKANEAKKESESAVQVEVTETEEITTAEVTDTEEAAETESAETVQAETEASAPAMGTVANTLAEDEGSLIATYSETFEQLTYTDSESGLSITYDLYLPEAYDASASYPMVVFIADSSCARGDASASLTQGRGALVWASEEWQSVHPTIVAVPTYPETILDDHGSYTTTEYVELTGRFIEYMCSEYAVDADRVYGTGQSMGCMTTLILDSEYADLYAACMFVDGQWDVSVLTGLEDRAFVYFAAEDDTNAWNGAQEVMAMFDADGVSYEYAQWDGTWSVDELSEAAQALFTEDEQQYFISWASGTIEAGSGGGMGGASYHMASFDYAYNCIAVMEWLFQEH